MQCHENMGVLIGQGMLLQWSAINITHILLVFGVLDQKVFQVSILACYFKVLGKFCCDHSVFWNRIWKNLTFRWPCNVKNSYNKNQPDALTSQIYFWNKTLHVLDSSSGTHSNGICHTGLLTANDFTLRSTAIDPVGIWSKSPGLYEESTRFDCWPERRLTWLRCFVILFCLSKQMHG
jgi:hypothetical protein